ncbi:histidine phosphatase family protein [Chitinophaga qingshengii]|uniref:Histidine phosphatase family protein n=1 Tax=Chitinophaga qingshengii TaxID=1569794 RepID=A0ABR7TIL9_9BACT|nr:histidine phosphatase family protein [Chitinophaga qingshengii]MBC9930351.1 histidine phosphatase family protein [Chitinophaga qingshengii]
MRLLSFIFCLVMLVACKPKAPVREPVPVTEDTTFLTGKFYLVRHAERHPGGADTSLTTEGFQRAELLYERLKDAHLDKIYLTPYLRSIQTADSLRIKQHLDTCFYKADTTGESLIYEITRHGDWGKRILVIGHSNTLVPLLHSLRAKPHMTTINENEYNWLFIVRKTSAGTSLTEDCY